MINVPPTMSTLSALSPLAPLTTLPPATQKYAEMQLDMLAEMTRKVVLALERVMNLQLHSTREAFEESSLAMRHCLEVRRPQEMMSLMTGRIEPSSRKALLYGNQLMEIITTTQAALVGIVENHFSEATRSVGKLVVDVTDAARKNGYTRATSDNSATVDIPSIPSSAPPPRAVVVSHQDQQHPAQT